MSKSKLFWSPDQLPPLHDQVILITGGNSGIGMAAVQWLAVRGAQIILACRDLTKGQKARDLIVSQQADAKIYLETLDLANFDSIERLVAKVANAYEGLNVLVNNAGVMMIPQQSTDDGFEMQFGTNHLGHFKLASLLYPLIKRSRGRIVTVSSNAHRRGQIDFTNLNGERNYSPWRAYAQSKLANLMFSLELHKRLQEKASPVKAIACHPGYAATNLALVAPQQSGKRWLSAVARLGNSLLAQSPQMGACPLVLAAGSPSAIAGAYYGPAGRGEWRGPAAPARIGPAALDATSRCRLWKVSEELCRVSWEF